MAMISCPECGKQVSDKAVSCINCGCPIAYDKSVRITFKPTHLGYGQYQHHIGSVWDINNNIKLFEGNLIEAKFEIEQPTMIRIFVDKAKQKAQQNLARVVEPGKKYEIRTVQQKAFYPIWGIIEVDVIDSGV